MANDDSMIGKPIRESISAWCDDCDKTTFMPPGIEDPKDPDIEIRTCEDGHLVKTPRYYFVALKNATRFDVPFQ
jgi:hypothetical protein